jgi:class 3 adenylate cyclase/predicted ATPase
VNIAAWLRGLGFEQYEPAFRANDIDERVLRSLTSEDLKDLGVTLVGHRRRLLDAIAALGADLSTAAVTAASRDLVLQADAQRRQLTVMFCDLVGSTALSARLDPEDLRDVIAAYHRAVAEIVAGFDGFIAKYMGDGVLIYFGYPRAHEDDAERAIRAGLDLIGAVGDLKLKFAELRARVGIATGLVVVGDLIGEGSAREQSVVGQTPNLAARLQAVAEPNAVVIAASTRRLVGDLFDYRDLGVVEVKGIGAAVPAWQVLRPSVIASRFEALRGSTLGPLVGRDAEIDLLLCCWRRARSGDGQVVLLSGEPGIGKSRVVTELAEHLNAEPHFRLRYFCSPYHQNSALFPFIEQLSDAAGFVRNDSSVARIEKLESLMARTTPPDEDVALLADLLSLPALQRHPLPNLSPQRKKERTFEALMRQLEVLARQQPLTMVFEDVHWIDPTSRELLDLIVERVHSLPVLLIVTFRPEFQPPWSGQPQVTMLALNRLDRRDRTDLVKQLAGGKALPDEVVLHIADRTDGVPLFVEELTKSVLESGLLRDESDRYVLDGALPPLAIPTSLHDSLMARLDRLAPVRLVAQMGAAIGREFSYALLRAVSRLPDDELQAALGRIVASELVFQRGVPPEAVYSFKHALVQDAVHGSLLRNVRQRLHGQIAEALEAHSPELMNSQPELFAQHYAEAGRVENSVAYWAKAGRRSAARSAMAEAAVQLQKGLDQLALLPDNDERRRRELEFWCALGAVFQVVKGFAAPESGRTYERARELWERLGSPSEFLQVPFGQSLYHMNRGELDRALRFDQDLLRLSRQRNDSAGLVLGHQSFGRNLLFAGRFALARSHLQEALGLYDPVSHQGLAQQMGTSPQVASQAFLANVLFCLGYPDQAVTRTNAAIAEARALAHPPSLALSLSIGSRVLSLVGDSAALDQAAGELISLATERRFPYWHALGAAFRGWVRVTSGDLAEGISLLRSSSAAYRATGSEAWTPHIIALLAEACEIGGQLEEARSLLDEAIQITERTRECWFAAELYRHKGEILLRLGHRGTAEQTYRKALIIAQEQEATLWELRAASSLAELHLDQGCRIEARDLLTPIYNRFSEGFDTPDLKKAKTLIEGLNT